MGASNFLIGIFLSFPDKDSEQHTVLIILSNTFGRAAESCSVSVKYSLGINSP